MATGVSSRREITPDTLDVVLYYWDECRWLLAESKPKSIRFHVVGKAMGSSKWRPHLIQHLDPLPSQGKRDFNVMLDALKISISTNTNLECVSITKDLLDDTSGE
tara:strand:- start:6 stop:320 length:315 start_codon:yes stop_codon:yes gene_type:complete